MPPMPLLRRRHDLLDADFDAEGQLAACAEFGCSRCQCDSEEAWFRRPGPAATPRSGARARPTNAARQRLSLHRHRG